MPFIDDIIVTVRTKGYTLADVRDTLKNAGYEVGEKALRDIVKGEAESKKTIPPFFLLKQHLKRQIQAGKMASI